MALRIAKNRLNHSAIIHTDVTGSVNVVGNSSVSNLTVNATSAEVITGAAITQAWFGGEATSVWVVKRGANTVCVLNPSGASYIDFRGNGASLDLDSTANLSITLTGGANAFCMLEVKKIGPTTIYQ